MIITNYIDTQRNKGRIFVCVKEVQEHTKCSKYYTGVFNNKLKYFSVLAPESREYKNIVGSITNERPIIVKSVGYGTDLTNIEEAMFMRGTQLNTVTNENIIRDLEKRMCWI